MCRLDFTLCLEIPDFWIRPALKLDRNEFYEHALLCTDASLVVS